jgi:hypothetical protein
MESARWNPGILQAARRDGDPEAAALVRAVFQGAGSPEAGAAAVGNLLQLLVRSEGIPRDRLPPGVPEFLDVSATVPAWYDERKVTLGERVFMAHGLLSLVSLLHASLPECYLMARGVHVLWMTQELEQHVFRRLIETAQMVVSVMSPGGLRSDGNRLTGPGVEVAQKVRVMHETMRHLILLGPAPAAGKAPAEPRQLADVMRGQHWNVEALGYPINQEDMAYTLLTFGYVIPRALQTMGADLSRDEQEAVLHAWNVVGHLMGVREEFIVHTMDEATELYGVIQRAQEGSTVMAQKMTASLIACVQDKLPVVWARWLPPVLVELLVGAEASRMLGLARPSVERWLLVLPILGVLRVLLAVEHLIIGHSAIGRRLLLAGGEDIVRILTQFPRGERDTSFDIPDEVARSWGLQPR